MSDLRSWTRYPMRLSQGVENMGKLLRSACILSAVFCVAFSPVTVVAQAYPSKPIRLILPSASNSGPDTNARLVVNEFSQQMGRQVVVENRGGADGIIG